MAKITVKHILDIQKGHARIFISRDGINTGMLLIGVSDNELEVGHYDGEMSFDINDVKEYVLGIRLEDYRQAEAYSIAFDKLAKKMKEDQNGNEI